MITTVTDQAGKQRRSVTDALGRLARVDEPTAAGLGLATAPNQPTHYTYDIQGNLRKVDQGGQKRYFLYDSLSRLLAAKQPEQGHLTPDAEFSLPATEPITGEATGWSMAYKYDAAGNLLKRKDAPTHCGADGQGGRHQETRLLAFRRRTHGRRARRHQRLNASQPTPIVYGL